MHPLKLRDMLRHETRAIHDRIDRVFSKFSLADDEGREKFLAAQAGALRTVESALEAGPCGGIESLVRDWPQRRRSHLFDGLDTAVPRLPPLSFRNAAEMVGALYVLEGSKLGARILLHRMPERDTELARRVASFLSHDLRPGSWSSFLATLDGLGSGISRDECVSGAMTAFSLFERSATLADGRAVDGDRTDHVAVTLVVSAGERHSSAPA